MSSGHAKNRILSTWTPLNNDEANRKIFEERRELINKWFEKWADTQRRRVLQDLLLKCKMKQLEFTGKIINKKRPVHHEDFTKHLPRVLSIYVFSFLDPRSLCRCSQVSWHWKSISELDQMWVPKCLRYGWTLPFTPSPYEIGVWKRLYIENVSGLHVSKPKEMPKSIFSEMERLQLGSTTPRRTPRPGSANSNKLKPWRGSDPVPKDTWRNNYLENEDETDHVKRLRQKGVYGSKSSMNNLIRNSKTKVNSGSHMPVNGKMTRSHSASMLYDSTDSRPEWAQAPSPAPSPMPTPTPTPTPNKTYPGTISHNKSPSLQRSTTPNKANVNGNMSNGISPGPTSAFSRAGPVKALPTHKRSNSQKNNSNRNAKTDDPEGLTGMGWSFPPPEEYDSDEI